MINNDFADPSLNFQTFSCYDVTMASKKSTKKAGTDSDTKIEIKSFMNRADDTFQFHEEALKSKVSKELFDNEIEHVERAMGVLFKKLDSAEKKFANMPVHTCVSEQRITDNREEIMEAHRSIRRLYIWQAGIGISLLVLFLTIGVAALSVVNKLTFQVEKNTEAITKIETKLEENDKNEKEELKQAIKEALKESR